jgi:hypothetical protein
LILVTRIDRQSRSVFDELVGREVELHEAWLGTQGTDVCDAGRGPIVQLKQRETDPPPALDERLGDQTSSTLGIDLARQAEVQIRRVAIVLKVAEPKPESTEIGETLLFAGRVGGRFPLTQVVVLPGWRELDPGEGMRSGEAGEIGGFRLSAVPPLKTSRCSRSRSEIAVKECART